MKTILVPCDFSTAAREAVEFAKEIALAGHGEVKVLHVIEPDYIYGNGMAGQPYSSPDPVLPMGDRVNNTQREFDKMKNESAKAKIPISFAVEKGPLVETVIKIAGRKDTDLIVMSTTGVKGISGFFIGSNSERIIRHCPVPIFVIHKMQHVKEIRDVIFPTSLDLTHAELVAKVKKLQSLFSAILHVLYITNFPASLISDGELDDALRKYARYFNLERYTLNKRRAPGLEEGIMKFASKIPDSIIAMSTHGYNDFEHFFKGSTAEDVLNHTSQPVWTYVSPGE